MPKVSAKAVVWNVWEAVAFHRGKSFNGVVCKQCNALSHVADFLSHYSLVEFDSLML